MTEVFDGFAEDLSEQFNPQTLTGMRLASSRAESYVAGHLLSLLYLFVSATRSLVTLKCKAA